ncbi:exocyst complex component Sec3-domain-containing protein [Peziza echinospora]|nr:exocyst complex component Sec3-domain-containing protein [Peziza echinospora]
MPEAGPGSAHSSASALTKAQKFEDEKKRIIQSCFAKVDETDGSLLESYITHCRVVEDAAYPSQPPPPDAPLDQKKARVILVAVRKSGRVRVHKARENQNGTYSIGKTWNLDDLKQIENHPPPHEKGFTVTILKAYYWQANSIKEKEFFIQSMLKIFKKYTGGKVPGLIGFEGTEIGQLAEGSGSSIQGGSITGPASISSAPSSARSSTRDGPPPRLPEITQPPNRQTPPPQLQAGQPSAPNTAGLYTPKDASPYKPLRAQQSTPSIRNKEEYMTLPPNPSLRNMQSAANLSPARPRDPKTLSQDSTGSANTMGNERRRPSDSSTRSGTSLNNAPRAESARGPSIDDQRSIRTTNSSIDQVEATVPKVLQKPKAPPPLITPLGRNIGRSDSPLTPTPPPIPDDDKSGKPGKKKSTSDIAARFRVAATTYSAGGLLGKNKSPTSSAPRTPILASPGSPDLPQKGKASGKATAGQSIKDKISGPIIDLPPRTEGRTSNDLPKPPPSPFERSGPSPYGRDTPRVVTPVPGTGQRDSMDGGEERLNRGEDRDQYSGQKRVSDSPPPKQRKESGTDSVLDELDTSQLSFQIDEVLKEFNWDWRGKVENLEADIKKELATVEAKNVLINPGGDERLEELSRLFDQAIEECEGLDGLLTLYAVELTSLTDDIAHIENQSQGLQVQTSNQKTLQKELERILSTITISPGKLDTLKIASLENNLDDVESTLLSLYKAIITIDPSISTNAANSTPGMFDDENVGSIRALQERKDGYRQESKDFLRRFRQFMNIKFQAEANAVQKIIREQDAAGQAGRAGAIAAKKPRLVSHDEAFRSLYKFAGLVLFAKEIDKEEYAELQRMYERPTKQLYQEELRDHIFAWKRITRKTTPEEAELVFTTQEKESERERITTTVRTLTVKRSQTLAKSLRSPASGEFSRDGSKKDSQEGKLYPNEAFSGCLDEVFKQICREQNFIIEFFHLHSMTNVSFDEFVQAGTPETRNLGDLGIRRTIDQDRVTGRIVNELIGDIFAFLMTDLGNLVDWSIKTDPLQGVGVLYSLEKSIRLLDETNQEFLIRSLQKLHDRLAGLFSKFLDEQVRAIEETKVKIKKRKGVIPFMKIFPQFTARIEDQLPPMTLDLDSSGNTGVRPMVNRGYDMINKAMFESLQAIARESGFGIPSGITPVGTTVVGGPGAHVPITGTDPEDKEQLNYHIMMIENMNHYVEDVDTRGNKVLADYLRRAEVEYKEHLGLYVGAVVRRPLGKLLDFIESIESQLSTSSSNLTIEDISTRASHSRHVLKKILSHYDSKEVKRGIETLRKRVDKHFAEGDDQDTSKRLLAKMMRELMEEYLKVRERMLNIITLGGTAYQGLDVEFSREDVVNAFTK